MIIDPRAVGNIKTTVGDIANCITGPFLSRETAEAYLEGTKYNFSKEAKVYCFSGYESEEWRKLCNK